MLAPMHIIRLRRPWERIRNGDAARIDVPDTSDNQPTRGLTTYTRSFNRPTGLDEQSRVYLCVASWHGSLKNISLNNQILLASTPPLKIEITSQLLAHNRLEISLADNAEKAGTLNGEVTLGIVDPEPHQT